MKLKFCRFCKSLNLVPILQLGNHYLSHFINSDEDKGKSYPLNTVLCTNCTLLQLDYTVPSNLLYAEDYGYKSGISEIIRADLKNIVEQAMLRVQLKEGDIWVSIGENDGTLLSFVPKNVIKVGVEPIKKLAKECEKHADIVINDFWSYEAYEKEVTKEKLSNVSKNNNKEKLSQSEKLGEG